MPRMSTPNAAIPPQPQPQETRVAAQSQSNTQQRARVPRLPSREKVEPTAAAEVLHHDETDQAATVKNSPSDDTTETLEQQPGIKQL